MQEAQRSMSPVILGVYKSLWDTTKTIWEDFTQRRGERREESNILCDLCDPCVRNFKNSNIIDQKPQFFLL